MKITGLRINTHVNTIYPPQNYGFKCKKVKPRSTKSTFPQE